MNGRFFGRIIYRNRLQRISGGASEPLPARSEWMQRGQLFGFEGLATTHREKCRKVRHSYGVLFRWHVHSPVMRCQEAAVRRSG